MIKEDTLKLKKIALNVRKRVLVMAKKKRIHIGPAFSLVEILTILYSIKLRKLEKNHIILSKGHGAMALYAVLAELGELPQGVIDDFGSENNILAGHPMSGIPGIEIPTGSLGHGLSIGAGYAISAKLNNSNDRTFVILGDGELNEGSVWEAIMFSAHNKLNGLVAIVDRNGYQQSNNTESVLSLEPLDQKWKSFGWDVKVVDGHSFEELDLAIEMALTSTEKPTVIIAKTVKGKGIDFMENNSSWHMGILDNEVDFINAINSLNTTTSCVD
ncbi:transketolase [Metabacillus halosaccharovorans]|uniref:transketolase n=1 Tax=Metabacillus halosaccharovorans TaxID=930124 RepID=UPI001C1FBCE4|nr:transketolase [Metabacillus halosaccharovorans]MBU7595703.1 transketolase [Metabacillus halosaccharovorans]